MKEFLLKIFLFFFPPILLLVIFNVKTDYYGVIWGNMETQKNEPNQRYLKIKHLLKNPKKHNAYIFGSSRVGKINTKNIEDSNSWYNMTYSEGLPYEHLVDLKLLISKGVIVENVIIGLDEISYLVAPEAHFDQNLRRPYAPFTIFHYLLLKPSSGLVKANYDAKKTSVFDIYNSGLPIPIYRDKWINTNKERHIQDSKFLKPNWSNYPPNRIDKTIAEIKEIIILCKQNNIKLTLFINPTHATTYKDLDKKDYFRFFKLLAELNSFYDFSGVNQITLDNFNYYETSHYRPIVGEMIKSVILDHNKTTFYHFITKDNVDSIISLKTDELAQCLNRHVIYNDNL